MMNFPSSSLYFKVHIIFKSLFRPEVAGGGFDEKFHVIFQRLCKASSHRCDVMGNFNFPPLVLWNIWQRHRHAPFPDSRLGLEQASIEVNSSKKQHHNLN
jgi:hypothetical protein